MRSASAIHANDDGCGGDEAGRHAVHANDGWGGGDCNEAKLVAPLSFDGTNFTLAPVRNCGDDVDLDDAPAWRATSSGQLSVNTATLTPCRDSGKSRTAHHDGGHGQPTLQLFIVAYQVQGDNGHHWGWGHDAIRGHDDGNGCDQGDNSRRHGIRSHHDGGGDGDDDNGGCAVQVAGPANIGDNPEVFNPLSPGLTTQAGSSYAFFIAEMTGSSSTPAASPPPPTPAPATMMLVAPLQWNGVTFSNVNGFSNCSNVTVGSAPSFTATTNGAFAGPLSTVTLAAECQQSSPGNLYIIAVQTGAASTSCNSGGGKERHATMRSHAGDTVQGWVIAGPADPTAATWTFAPSPGNLVTQQCATYEFYAAEQTGGK